MSNKLLTPGHLSPEQVQAYKDMLTREVMCITSDCGFGKSISFLNAFTILKKKHPHVKALVVCNPEGVKNTWSVEHTKWTHTQHLKVACLNDKYVPTRLKKLKSDVDIYVISYGSLKWLIKNNKYVEFNFVFGDEADCLKGPDSKWRGQLLEAAPRARYRILATATPKTREEDDYWGLCKYLDNGQSLNAPTVSDFRQQYCRSYAHNHRQIWKINPHKVEELEARIKHLFIKYKKSDKANIPIVTRTAYADLSPESRAKYDLLQETQCVNSVVYKENDRGHMVIDDDKSLDAMTLSGKLNQLSSGFLYMNEHLRITPEMLAQTTNVKKLLKETTQVVAVDVFDDRYMKFLKLIKMIHKTHGDEANIIIPYHYKHELVQLKRILPDGVSDTEKGFLDRWNNKEIKYLFLQYSRSSKSLNLQKGGNIMAVYCPTFSWVNDYQITRRIARQGQPEPEVYVYRLYLRDTIDDIKTKKLDDRFKGHKRFQNKILAKAKKAITL